MNPPDSLGYAFTYFVLIVFTVAVVAYLSYSLYKWVKEEIGFRRERRYHRERMNTERT